MTKAVAVQGRKKRLENVTLEGVKLIFSNFGGAEKPFNKEGDRNFGVLLDDETAEAMQLDGWNVKYLKPRDEGDKPQAMIRVKVNMKSGRKPRIFMVTSRNKTMLDEASAEVLDWSNIKAADVTLNPYAYDVNGNTGITAYLVSIYATIEEDYLDLKYADVPDSIDAGRAQQALEEAIEEAVIVDDGEDFPFLQIQEQ